MNSLLIDGLCFPNKKRMCMKTPCMNCTRREMSCHSTCEDYKEFRKKVEGAKARRDADLACYVINAKARKKRGQK